MSAQWLLAEKMEPDFSAGSRPIVRGEPIKVGADITLNRGIGVLLHQ